MSELTFSECWIHIQEENVPFLAKWNMLWLMFQTITFVPMAAVTIYRLKNQIANEDYYDTKKPLPYSFTDLLIKIYISFYIIFYVPELIIHLFNIDKICKICSIVHHIVTIWGAYNSLKIRHFAWFCIAPPSFHALLLIYPNKQYFLNYLYLITIICTYFGLKQRPYKGRTEYDNSIIYIYLLIFPLLGFWKFNCKNVIELKH
jgi:hypothetical protein